MYKAVIFDMDGVLIKSEEFYFERRMEFFKKIGVKPDSTDIKDYIGASNKEVWQHLVADEKKRTNIKKTYLKYQKSHVIDYLDYVDKDVYKVISFLQSNKIKMILASAGERIEIGRMLIECHLKKYFDIVLSGEEVANNKPAPDIYLKAVDESGVDKEKCVVIEDSPIGIEAAKKAGLLVWAIKTNIDQTGADKILSNMREIIMNMNLLT